MKYKQSVIGQYPHLLSVIYQPQFNEASVDAYIYIYKTRHFRVAIDMECETNIDKYSK